jgi:hypothetical protein
MVDELRNHQMWKSPHSDFMDSLGYSFSEYPARSHLKPHLRYVGDISGIFQNTITPTCCMAPSKRRTVKKPSLVVLTFGIFEILRSVRIQE